MKHCFFILRVVLLHINTILIVWFFNKQLLLLYWLFAVGSLIKFFAYNTQKSLLYRLGGKGLFLLQTRFAVKPKHPV